MQRYQVFIDEHSIFIGDPIKSNQQFKTVVEVFGKNEIKMGALVEKLSKEKEKAHHICYKEENTTDFWNYFKSEFKNIEAAGGLVENENGEMLFIHRLGKWDLPKGKMEKGETPEQSALREVEEECGISDLSLGESFPPTYHMYFHKGKWVLKKTYWFKMKYSGNQKLIPQTEEAIDKVVWIARGAVEDQLNNTYSSLKGLIELAK